jgi:hypothetical protein
MLSVGMAAIDDDDVLTGRAVERGRDRSMSDPWAGWGCNARAVTCFSMDGWMDGPWWFVETCSI